jgi:outer membrane receptor protein involved in Fe transport
LIPQRDSRGLLVWAADYGDAANLKAARLPLYARVDIRATYKPRWMDDRWQLYFEIINVLNRKNAGSLESTLEYDSASDRPRVVTRPGSALPLLPTIGLRFRF